MLKIGLVKRARRQEHHTRVLALHGRELHESVPKAPKKRSEPRHFELAKQIRESFRQYDAILERIACARWGLRAIGNYPPLAVRSSRQVHSKQMQVGIVCNRQSVTRPPEPRVSKNKGRWDLAAVKQLLRAIKIGQNQIQKKGSLDQPRFEPAPFRGLNN